ncbi:MAG: FAD-binding oxidoreductase [Myxococcota bacterium]|nr:FAD-binding oxidoreductase [Myxococcota bacterium]
MAPPAGLIQDPEILEGYLTDASNIPGQASGLLRPDSAEQVAEIFRAAQAQGQPLTVTAQRTSTTGGPVPHGGWLLSTERLRGLRWLDDQRIRVGAAELLAEVEALAQEKGRFYPPDPTSWRECSVGGTLACNASGARSYRYGATRPWVESAQVVLPTGEIVEADRSTPIPAHWPVPEWTPPQVKTAAGYHPADNLLDLIIGSEGTLGLVTAATLRTLPLPERVFSILAFFPSIQAGLDFVEAARQAQAGPRLLEWYDAGCLELVRARVPEVPSTAVAAVWIEVETDAQAEDQALMNWADLLSQTGALEEHTLFAADESGMERLGRIRHAIPAGVNEQVVANGMPKVGTDFAVPDAGLARMMAAYGAVELESVLFGHIGDNHLHLNLLPKTPQELEQAWAIWGRLYDLALSLGGTLSAEHGVGKLKQPYLRRMVGDPGIAAFQALKRAADPAWILGRGSLLADPVAASSARSV